MKTLFAKYPWFVWLLPIFFVFHGYQENYGFVPLPDALLLAGIYLAATALLLLLFTWLFRTHSKAAIFSAAIMSFFFFFGSIQDSFRSWFAGSIFSRYVFLLPFGLVLLMILFAWLRRYGKGTTKFVTYLNLLFILLIGIDIFLVVEKITRSGSTHTLPAGFAACMDCKRPDVYIIIADEYAGNDELKDIFGFDDSAFQRQLVKRGFQVVPHSSSNYNYTPYSIASTLEMDYLDLGRTPLLPYTYSVINDNRFLRFLEFHGYELYNFSFFDVGGQPTHTQETFLPNRTRLITSQTLLNRVAKELRFHLSTDLGWKEEQRKQAYFNLDNNRKLTALTLSTSQEKSPGPRLVLTHLMMPHYPYYFDREGRAFPFETLLEGNQGNRERYIEYLQYANGQLLALVDHLLANSASPPIIVLMGDHGFRHFKEDVARKYYFSNFVSVHMPEPVPIPDSITNVNLLRWVLNTGFRQQLPYLADSSYIMENP